jgi:hypothetical protein
MTHLIKTVMVYPPGYVPSGWEAPEGYVPEGSIEDYNLAFAEAAPVLGQKFQAYGQSWEISRVQTYVSQEQHRHATGFFHLAIATLDGSVPVREPWHDGRSPLLVVHATDNRELVANEHGEPHWELVEREEWISSFENWEIQSLQHLEPMEEKTSGDYDRVIIAWLVSVDANHEHPDSVAA